MSTWKIAGRNVAACVSTWEVAGQRSHVGIAVSRCAQPTCSRTRLRYAATMRYLAATLHLVDCWVMAGDLQVDAVEAFASGDVQRGSLAFLSEAAVGRQRGRLDVGQFLALG